MNKYEKIGVIGEGTFGVVLKCRHKDTNELVAIKKFKEQSEEDEVAKKITLREVKLLRALKHENIVELKEAFRRKGVLYLVFEHVEQSVMDLLEANPKGVGTDTVQKLTFQLLRALEHCHRRNVIHRDIKPENLLVNSSDESLRLCDFGCARQMKDGVPMTDYVATRWYRPPELLLSVTDYGKGVDIWAVGCIMGELSDGVPLFAGKSDVDQLFVIQKILGPLTPTQMSLCLELSDFQGAQFPDVSHPMTLHKRYAGKMHEMHLSLLTNILVMDADQRLSAKAALRFPCFKTLRALQREPATQHREQHADKHDIKSGAVAGASVAESRPSVPKLQVPNAAHNTNASAQAALPGIALSGLPSLPGHTLPDMESEDPFTVRSHRHQVAQRPGGESPYSRRELRTPPEDGPLSCDEDHDGSHLYDVPANGAGRQQPLERKSTPQVLDMYRLPWENKNPDDPGLSEYTRSPTPIFGSGSQMGFLADQRGAGTTAAGPPAKNGKVPIAATVARWNSLGMRESRWSGA